MYKMCFQMYEICIQMYKSAFKCTNVPSDFVEASEEGRGTLLGWVVECCRVCRVVKCCSVLRCVVECCSVSHCWNCITLDTLLEYHTSSVSKVVYVGCRVLQSVAVYVAVSSRREGHSTNGFHCITL